MDKAKLIDLLYDVLPYAIKGEQFEVIFEKKVMGENPLLRRFVSNRIKEAIATLEKWEGA
ncbi:MAG: hypothetical protein ACK5DE_01050 [Bacteroidota bacterium]|jgi:hypothetical protein